jgi:tungstate transport system substrate-binding protein
MGSTRIEKECFMRYVIIFTLVFLHFCGITAAMAKGQATLLVATTTSLQDTGLMEKITSLFTKETGIKVKVIAAGTGEALKMGARGDVDVVLVHAKKEEEKFMAEKNGSERHELFYNFFTPAGPTGDPAGVKKASTAGDAFKTIAAREALFVSRADGSGTHIKEMEIWGQAGITPKGKKWYIESGGGMAQALRVADEKKAYILCDQSTLRVMAGTLSLVPCLEKKDNLKNIYSLILVNPEKNKKVHAVEARKFSQFVRSDRCRELIGAFKSKGGEPLFFLLDGLK